MQKGAYGFSSKFFSSKSKHYNIATNNDKEFYDCIAQTLWEKSIATIVIQIMCGRINTNHYIFISSDSSVSRGKHNWGSR